MTYIRGACYSSRLRVRCHRADAYPPFHGTFLIFPRAASRGCHRTLSTTGFRRKGWVKKKGTTFSVHNAPVPDGDDDTARVLVVRSRRSYILVGGDRGEGGRSRLELWQPVADASRRRDSLARGDHHTRVVRTRFRTVGVRIAREIYRGTDKEKTSGHNPERREERRQNKSSSFIVPSPEARRSLSSFVFFFLFFFLSSSLTIESNAQTGVRCNREVYPKKGYMKKSTKCINCTACLKRDQIEL